MSRKADKRSFTSPYGGTITTIRRRGRLDRVLHETQHQAVGWVEFFTTPNIKPRGSYLWVSHSARTNPPPGFPGSVLHHRRRSNKLPPNHGSKSWLLQEETSCSA
jgi:hypothetical protein